MIKLPDKCLRKRDNCEPLAQIESDNGKSFICCGLNDGSTRQEPQDIFTHCWVNGDIDDETDWDKRDITDTISVFAQTLSVYENMEENKR